MLPRMHYVVVEYCRATNLLLELGSLMIEGNETEGLPDTLRVLILCVLGLIYLEAFIIDTSL